MHEPSEQKRDVTGLHEILPLTGQLHTKHQHQPVFCKPKLLPLKSQSVEKIESVQRRVEERSRTAVSRQ